MIFRFFVSLSLVLGFVAKAANPNSAANHHVIIITIDGFPAYLFDDSKMHIPTLRKLAAEGVIAKGMKVSSPAVTWPNHTTLVTGVHPEKHSVLVNGIFARGKNGEINREPEHDKFELVAVPTVYDFLHERGFSTAEVNWPCTRNAKTLDDSFPDVPQMIRYTTPRLAKELEEAGIFRNVTDETFSKQSPVERDNLWTRAACHVLRTRKPNFFLFHLLLADGTQHRFGPQSPEAYSAFATADKNIQELLNTLDKAGIREQTTLLILADHGFTRVTNTILANVVLRKAGLQQPRVQAVSEGGIAMIYLNAPASQKQDRKSVIELFKHHEGVEKILEPKDYKKYGMPLPKNNPQMADLVLAAKDGYGFGSGTEGDKTIIPANSGSHGYLSDNPKMDALFIATGRGIKTGKKIGLIENIDVAPTAAYLLGEKLPNVDGKVLKQILTGPE